MQKTYKFELYFQDLTVHTYQAQSPSKQYFSSQITDYMELNWNSPYVSQSQKAIVGRDLISSGPWFGGEKMVVSSHVQLVWAWDCRERLLVSVAKDGQMVCLSGIILDL